MATRKQARNGLTQSEGNFDTEPRPSGLTLQRVNALQAQADFIEAVARLARWRRKSDAGGGPGL